MEIVLDTNVLIASLLKNGLTRKIIFLSPFKMYTAEYAKIEIEIHKKEILCKSKLNEQSLNYLSNIIFSRIDFISSDHMEPFKGKAKEIMQDIDIDDSFLVALAMSLNCPVWSNDTHMKKQSVVKVYTTNEIMDFLKIL
jgi:predicted nucleic acid-binding protein